MGIDKKYLTQGIPETAWFVNKANAERDYAYLTGPNASYVEIKAVFDEQLEYYEMVRERLLHEIALRKQAFIQTRLRRVALSGNKGRNIKEEVTPFPLPEEWTLKEAVSYKQLLKQFKLLYEWCVTLHDEFDNITQYFLMKIAKARKFGLLLEDRPVRKYKMFTRSHVEKEQFMYYVPFPLLMRDIIGPAKNYNALQYHPGKPGHRLWYRLIEDMVHNLVGRKLLPYYSTNVYDEEEDTADMLFMKIRLKKEIDREELDTAAIRIDLLYAIIMTRSDEDKEDFEEGFERMLLGQMIDVETIEGIRGFARRQWHEVFEPTDVMEYWNIR